jgi:hypothetical protein
LEKGNEMKFLAEMNDQVECLIENTMQGKKFYIEGPFLSYDTPNKNNRVYSESIMRPAVGKYISEYVEPKRAVGELNHPASPSINLDRVSHIIESLNFRESTKHVIGKAKLLETPMGKIAQQLMEGGVKLGVSSRGLGSVKMMEGRGYVQNDFTINTVDIVNDPSGFGCMVDPILENAEWILRNGEWLQITIDHAKKKINEDTAIKEFAKLMKLLKA